MPHILVCDPSHAEWADPHKTPLRLHLQHKTQEPGRQHGQNPVMAVVVGIASETPVVLYETVYHRSPRNKSLIRSPEACN